MATKTVSEKIKELQEEQATCVKQLEELQKQGIELQNLIQRQTGALRILLDIQQEEGLDELANDFKESEAALPEGFRAEDPPISNKKGE